MEGLATNQNHLGFILTRTVLTISVSLPMDGTLWSFRSIPNLPCKQSVGIFFCRPFDQICEDYIRLDDFVTDQMPTLWESWVIS